MQDRRIFRIGSGQDDAVPMLQCLCLRSSYWQIESLFPTWTPVLSLPSGIHPKHTCCHKRPILGKDGMSTSLQDYDGDPQVKLERRKVLSSQRQYKLRHRRALYRGS